MRPLLIGAVLTALFHPTSSHGEIHLAAFLEAGGSTAVAVSGNHMLGGLGRFLLSIDASDPVHPARVSSHQLPGTVYDIIVSGPLAYVGAGNLSIFDISNPAEPVLVGTEPGGIAPRSFGISPFRNTWL